MTVKRLTRPKAGKALLSLLVLAALGVALQSVVFSGASFTGGSSNLGNVFLAGTLAHVNSKAGTVVLDAANLRPGQSKSRTLTITGTGSLPGAYTLRPATPVVDTPASPKLSNALVLTIQDATTGATLYNGPVAAFASTSPAISIGPDVTHTLQFTLTYPSTPVDPALQGATMSLTIQVTGVST